MGIRDRVLRTLFGAVSWHGLGGVRPDRGDPMQSCCPAICIVRPTNLSTKSRGPLPFNFAAMSALRIALTAVFSPHRRLDALRTPHMLSLSHLRTTSGRGEPAFVWASPPIGLGGANRSP